MKAFWYNENRKNIIGLEIRKLRREKNLSTRDLAAKIQVSGYDEITENTISKIEHGHRFVPDYEVKIFADVLNTTPNKLLEFSQKTSDIKKNANSQKK